MRVLSAPAIIAIIFACVASAIALRGDLIDDEGYITFLGALVVRDAPVAGFFFQKFHPSLSALYAPVVGFGWRAFLIVHALFGAIGVFLIGAIATRLGGSGLTASAVLALSPIYLLSAVSGQSNSDGFVLMLLALWLVGLRDRRWAHVIAGFLLAAAVWARYELVLAVALLGLDLLLHRQTRWAALGLAVGPALYLLVGAGYHHNALWWLHLPPTLPRLLPGMDSEGILPRTPGQALVAAAQLSLVSVVWLLPFRLDPSTLSPETRLLRSAFFLTLAAMVVVPFLRVLNFEHSPRYLSVTLPFAAVLAGRWVVAPMPPRQPVAVAVAVTVAVAALVVPTRVTPALAITALLPIAAALPRPYARTLLVLVASVTSVVFSGDVAPTFRRSRAEPDTLAVARWLRAHADGRVLYTNDQRLAMTLVAQDRRPSPRYLVAFDIQMEMLALLNAHNGQRDAVLRAISPRLYGEAAWVCEFARRPPPPRALFALNQDERIQRYFPRALWDAHTHLLANFGTVEVRGLNEGDQGFAPQIDHVIGMSSAQRDAPCDALGLTPPR